MAEDEQQKVYDHFFSEITKGLQKKTHI